MKAHSAKLLILAGLLAATAVSCGEVARNGRSPSQLIITSMLAAPGVDDDEFGTFLLSDVSTFVEGPNDTRVETFFNDPGQVRMRLILKDPGVPGVPSAPTSLNEVTITRYRVVFRRADGRNTPGVDVPFPFDSAVTFTVPATGEVEHGFNLVRHTAKREAPLAALRDQFLIISTIAEVTFYGRDAAGHEVSVTGAIGVEFGNFGDPD